MLPNHRSIRVANCDFWDAFFTTLSCEGLHCPREEGCPQSETQTCDDDDNSAAGRAAHSISLEAIFKVIGNMDYADGDSRNASWRATDSVNGNVASDMYEGQSLEPKSPYSVNDSAPSMMVELDTSSTSLNEDGTSMQRSTSRKKHDYDPSAAPFSVSAPRPPAIKHPSAYYYSQQCMEMMLNNRTSNYCSPRNASGQTIGWHPSSPSSSSAVCYPQQQFGPPGASSNIPFIFDESCASAQPVNPLVLTKSVEELIDLGLLVSPVMACETPLPSYPQRLPFVRCCYDSNRKKGCEQGHKCYHLHRDLTHQCRCPSPLTHGIRHHDIYIGRPHFQAYNAATQIAPIAIDTLPCNYGLKCKNARHRDCAFKYMFNAVAMAHYEQYLKRFREHEFQMINYHINANKARREIADSDLFRAMAAKAAGPPPAPLMPLPTPLPPPPCYTPPQVEQSKIGNLENGTPTQQENHPEGYRPW